MDKIALAAEIVEVKTWNAANTFNAIRNDYYGLWNSVNGHSLSIVLQVTRIIHVGNFSFVQRARHVHNTIYTELAGPNAETHA
jgi:hypothetical protein